MISLVSAPHVLRRVHQGIARPAASLCSAAPIERRLKSRSIVVTIASVLSLLIWHPLSAFAQSGCEQTLAIQDGSVVTISAAVGSWSGLSVAGDLGKVSASAAGLNFNCFWNPVTSSGGGGGCSGAGDTNPPNGIYDVTIKCYTPDQNGNWVLRVTRTRHYILGFYLPAISVSPQVSSYPPVGFGSQITIQGSVTDNLKITSMTITSAIGTSTAGYAVFNPDSFDGKNFTFNIQTSSLAISLGNSPTFSLWLNAADESGNIVGYAPASGLLSVATGAVVLATVDHTPPSVSISTDVAGNSLIFSRIWGLISDDYQVARLFLSIQKVSPTQYWDGAQFSGGASTISISLPAVASTTWQYNVLSSTNLELNTTYVVKAWGADIFGNTSSQVLSRQFSVSAAVQPAAINASQSNRKSVQFLQGSGRTTIGYADANPGYICALIPDADTVAHVAFTSNRPLAFAAIGLIDYSACSVLGARTVFFTSSLDSECDDNAMIYAMVDNQIIDGFPVTIVTPRTQQALYRATFNAYNRGQNQNVSYIDNSYSLAPGTECSQFPGAVYPCAFKNYDVAILGPNAATFPTDSRLPTPTFAIESLSNPSPAHPPWPVCGPPVQGRAPLTYWPSNADMHITGPTYMLADNYGVRGPHYWNYSCSDVKTQTISIGQCNIKLPVTTSFDAATHHLDVRR